MDRILKTFLNSYALVGFFTVMGYWLFFRRNNKGSSSNPKVNSSINILDNAMNRFGTNFEDIKQVFSDLNKYEIITLYKDFGIRRYDELTGTYVKISFEFANIVTDKDLRGILDSELDSSQHEELKQIHESKGLQYPYLTK